MSNNEEARQNLALQNRQGRTSVETEGTVTEDCVILTAEEVAQSERNKAKKKRTIRQLPVYRGACDMTFSVAEIERACPRKYRCFVDELEGITTEMLTLLAMANEVPGMRREYLTQTNCLMTTLIVKLEIIYKLGVIGKDRWQKMKRLADSVTAQVIGWRNSVNMEGVQ